jgi:hypothetical protein
MMNRAPTTPSSPVTVRRPNDRAPKAQIEERHRVALPRSLLRLAQEPNLVGELMTLQPPEYRSGIRRAHTDTSSCANRSSPTSGGLVAAPLV